MYQIGLFLKIALGTQISDIMNYNSPLVTQNTCYIDQARIMENFSD